MSSPRVRFNSARLFDEIAGSWDILPQKPQIRHLPLSPSISKLSLSPAASLSPDHRSPTLGKERSRNMATFERNLSRLFVSNDSETPSNLIPNRARFQSDFSHVRANKNTILYYLEHKEVGESRSLRPQGHPELPPSLKTSSGKHRHS